MYLGAGLASLLIQALIGAIVAGPILVVVFRKRVKAFFLRSRLGKKR